MKKSNTKDFIRDWLVKFYWLDYDENENLMRCNLCFQFKEEFPQEFNKIKNARLNFINGTNNFRISALVDHNKSFMHVEALKVITNNISNNNNQLQIFQINDSIKEELQDFYFHFKSIIFICSNNLPFTNYSELMNLLTQVSRKSNPDKLVIKHSHQSYSSGRELLTCLYEAAMLILENIIESTEFIGISCHTSTDISNN